MIQITLKREVSLPGTVAFIDHTSIKLYLHCTLLTEHQYQDKGLEIYAQNVSSTTDE